MRLAIMQPYMFPYLGYFQLIKAVDAFVIYEDVNYIKGGWINRNYILANGNRQLITLPLQSASQNKLIKQIKIVRQHKILKSLSQNYSKAPYYGVAYPIIEKILTHSEINLASFLEFQLRCVCDYLGLMPKWYVSSEIKKDSDLRGQEKIIAICQEIGATQYVNLPSGKSLYDEKIFYQTGIKLTFILPNIIEYEQFGKSFQPNLSIIDVMMFNSPKECSKLLERYQINE